MLLVVCVKYLQQLLSMVCVLRNEANSPAKAQDLQPVHMPDPPSLPKPRPKKIKPGQLKMMHLGQGWTQLVQLRVASVHTRAGSELKAWRRRKSYLFIFLPWQWDLEGSPKVCCSWKRKQRSVVIADLHLQQIGPWVI